MDTDTSETYAVVGSVKEDAASELLWASPTKNLVIASGSSDSCNNITFW